MKVWKSIFPAIVGVATVGVLVPGLLIWRGFRATSVPSAFETAVARTLRNLAIPAHERRNQNPLHGDSEALQAGREDFLSRCAICHGVDGSGKTTLGQGLYPRVPDLHASRTQNLTDGEIHYIIENGVQLTGMPAWRNAHHESDDDSWKLVLFVRSLMPLVSNELSQQAHVVSSAHYVGSQACAEMPCRNIRAVAEDADGERCARSANASERHHSRPCDKHRSQVHKRASGICLWQHLETAIFHQSRRRLFSASRAMGRRHSRMAAIHGSFARSRLVGGNSILQTTCSDRPARYAMAAIPSTTTSTPSK